MVLGQKAVGQEEWRAQCDDQNSNEFDNSKTRSGFRAQMAEPSGLARMGRRPKNVKYTSEMHAEKQRVLTFFGLTPSGSPVSREFEAAGRRSNVAT